MNKKWVIILTISTCVVLSACGSDKPSEAGIAITVQTAASNTAGSSDPEGFAKEEASDSNSIKASTDSTGKTVKADNSTAMEGTMNNTTNTTVLNNLSEAAAGDEQILAETAPTQFKLEKLKDEKFVSIGGRPYGIAFGSDGILYAAIDRNEIVKVQPDGKISPFFKTDETNSTGLTAIWDVQEGPDGNIYVPAGDRLFKITPKGEETILIQDPGVFPAGITFDPKGNFYITSGLKVFKYTKALQQSVFIDAGKSVNSMLFLDLKFDKDYKNIYVTNFAGQQLVKYPVNSDGTTGERIVILDTQILESCLGGQKPGWFSKLQSAHPSWFSTDGDGNLYVSVEDIYSILKIGTDHTYTIYEIDQPFFNSTIAFGKGGFDKDSLYTTGYEDGFIHKLVFP